MISDIAIAVLLTLCLSILIWIIDLMGAVNKPRVKVLIGFMPFIYLLLLFFGNIVTTIVAASFINTSASFQSFAFFDTYRWFWYSIIGVFSFEAIIQNINLTYSDKGILTISDWVSKARYSAIAAIVEKEVEIGNDEIQKLTVRIRKLSESEIDTHIMDYLGEERFEELNRIITENSTIDQKLIKAKALAQDAFNEISSLLRANS